MSSSKPRIPVIEKNFRQFLRDENTASFIRTVSENYTESTLQRLARCKSRAARRAAILALGFVGGYGSNATVGRAMTDRDRAVRVLAENGIRSIWQRAAGEFMCQQILIVSRLNSAEQYHEAIKKASQLIDQSPEFSEAWHQRAIALIYCGEFSRAKEDCLQAIKLNSYHFSAATRMGQCCLELGEPLGALKCFRRALRLNPGLEDVRAQVIHLRRILDQR